MADYYVEGNGIYGFDCMLPNMVFDWESDMESNPLTVCGGGSADAIADAGIRRTKTQSGTTSAGSGSAEGGCAIVAADGGISAAFTGEAEVKATVTGSCCGIAHGYGKGEASVSVVFEICESGCLTLEYLITAQLLFVDAGSLTGSWSLSGPSNHGDSYHFTTTDSDDDILELPVSAGTYTFSASFDWNAEVTHATDVQGGAECADDGPENATPQFLFTIDLAVSECAELQARADECSAVLASSGEELALLLADWKSCS